MYSDKEIFQQLDKQYRETMGGVPESIVALPSSGSSRRYFRIAAKGESCIGVFHEDLSENEAFISFTGTFRRAGLPVPMILSVSEDRRTYMQTDLGDTTLFAYLQTSGESPAIKTIYQEVLGWLPVFQRSEPDYGKCYPRSAFDRQSMLWDLSYFKYYFLKLSEVTFNEQLLEDDFNTLTAFLLSAPGEFFLYRDFQSRNIMLVDRQPWFIDYQGGRKGPLQYDVASLLYDAKADLSEALRHSLLEHYLEEACMKGMADRKSFMHTYPAFILIRILQALGAYGFRGYYQKKTHFLQSIPYALKNLERLIRDPFAVKLPELMRVLSFMVEAGGKRFLTEEITASNPEKGSQPLSRHHDPATCGDESGAVNSGLTVTIVSFSYRKGIPEDETDHGGGFVFDCRALPNPGRFPEYRELTGKDPSVIQFLEKEEEVSVFLQSIFRLITQSAGIYFARGFTHLMVAFGCTGGQHRSVYCAEKLKHYLQADSRIKVKLSHREFPGH